MAFAPDYGLRLMRDGTSADGDLIFHDFRLFSLDVLGRGQYSTVVEKLWDGQFHALSLDFNHEQLERILANADARLATSLRSALARDPSTPRAIDFEGEVAFAVRARLGRLQTAAKEQYVPLVVQEIL